MVTVLSAMPWASVVKLVAMENTDTTVLAIQTIHQTTMGRRSRGNRSSAAASSRA